MATEQIPDQIINTMNAQEPDIVQNNRTTNTRFAHTDFHLMLDSLEEAYCVIELIFDRKNKPLDYRFIETNLAFEKHSGLNHVTGKCISELVPENYQYGFEEYAEVALTGKAVRFQRWTPKLWKYYDVYAFRIGNPEERKVGIFFNDLTARKQAEDNLSFLFDLTKTLIAANTQEEILHTVSTKIGAYLKLTYFFLTRTKRESNEAEVLYQWHLPFLPDAKQYYQVADMVSADIRAEYGQGKRIVVDDTTGDSRVLYNRMQAEHVGSFITIPLERNQEYQFSVSLCRDEAQPWRQDEISLVEEAANNLWTCLERKRVTQELANSEERLRLSIETGKIGICDMDYLNGTTLCNDIRYKMYGMTPKSEATPASDFLARTHPEDLEVFLRDAQSGIEKTGKYKAEFRVIHPDGTVVWIAESGQVTEWKEGRPQRVISTLIDITQRKTEQEQKDDFFKIASHELKSPVTNMKSVVYMLDEKLQETNDPMTLELNRQLQRQTERLNRLIGNLLDASRAAAGHLDYHFKKIDLPLLLQEVVEDLQNTTLTHKLRLAVVPLQAIKGDAMRLTQVFTNLISNAIKYTPSSARSEPKEIFIEAHHVGNEIRVTISDPGIGMSAGTQAHLFERFFRSDSPETHYYSGLGLGLYISREIMKQHGGDICVQSTKGKGSVFTIVLPAAS